MNLRFIGAVLLLGMWGALVLLHLAPAGPYIDTMRDTLFCLGIYHATTNNPKG